MASDDERFKKKKKRAADGWLMAGGGEVVGGTRPTSRTGVDVVFWVLFDESNLAGVFRVNEMNCFARCLILPRA